ncbi:terminase small subunit [Bacillus sp. JJ722]|uniref:terminase small subunit n=1 Tax=Bacillus sp. JJ722 TaxID=3122973 RepID=UPI002FFE7BA3
MEEEKKLTESEEELIDDDTLTPKEKLFCTNYLKHFNAAKAYEEAGYKSNYAKQAAHIMLKKEEDSGNHSLLASIVEGRDYCDKYTDGKDKIIS